MNESEDDSHTDAAEWIVGDDGSMLLDAASDLFASDVSDANAQKRLAPMARAFISEEAARQAALIAWVMATERKKAVSKLGEMGVWALFDSAGLQMASSKTTAEYHARLLKQAGAETVVDMTAGIGVDTMSIVSAGIETTGYETDPARATFARKNAAQFVHRQSVEILNSDSTLAAFPPAAFVYADPPRRTDRGRWGNVAATEEMVSAIVAKAPRGALIKLAPAIDISIAERFNGHLEFVSADGECKEALLSLGDMRMSGEINATAVLLPSGEKLSAQQQIFSFDVISPVMASYLYEPDPAVIRAGLVPVLASRYGLSSIDPNIAYLLSCEPVVTPFAKA